MIAAAATLSLAACSGEGITGLSQMVYNATYAGPATLRPLVVPAQQQQPAGQPLTMTVVLAQLGQNFGGTFSIADSAGHAVYAGSITGKVTSSGADITLVVPAPCAGTLYGSFTVSNGELNGSATGRDCMADASGNNVQITFTNLVRQ